MRITLRHRALPPLVAGVLYAGPAIAQEIVQHCTLVEACTTVKTEIFGIVIREERACQVDVICHYHTR